MFFLHIWCFVKFSSLSPWGCPVLIIYNFTSGPRDLYQGTTSAKSVVSSSSSYWSLWPRKALHSVRGVYKSCWLTVCLVFHPPVLLCLKHRNQEHQLCHTTTKLLSASIYLHSFSREVFQGPPLTFFDIPRYFAFSRTSPWLIFIQTQNLKDCCLCFNTSFSSHFCKPPF